MSVDEVADVEARGCGIVGHWRRAAAATDVYPLMQRLLGPERPC